MTRPYRNFMGIDDGPFRPEWRGDVPLVGISCVGARLDGVVRGKVRRDGRNSTAQIAQLIAAAGSPPRVVFLQGIAVAGFNVVDLDALHARCGRPLVVVARRRPNLARIRRALLERVPGGARKWALVERAGPMEPAGDVWVQRRGISHRDAEQALAAATFHGNIPEPLRLAHLIAGAFVDGRSRGRA